MMSNKEAQRRQRRRELDARRSKLRVRLGSWPESWSELKDQLGFSLHSELAQFLLNSYSCKTHSSGSGDRKNVISVTVATLDQLILLVHCHSQKCPLTPSLQPDPHRQEVKKIQLDEEPKTSTGSSETAELLRFVCEDGHMLTWCPSRTETEDSGEKSEQGSAAASGLSDGQKKGVKQVEVCRMRSRRGQCLADGLTARSSSSVGNKEAECLCASDAVRREQDAASQEGSDASLVSSSPDISVEPEADDAPNTTGTRTPVESRDPVEAAVPNSTTSGRKRTKVAPKKRKSQTDRQHSGQDQGSQTNSSRKRKATPKLILPCEFDGCWKIFSSRQYLNHHMKYQHIQQKTFACSHPSCGKCFNYKKHLKEHEKLHRDQRDFICEFCARAFRTSSNLSIHRRIHTGEKPLQCEVCGFTCRQKASLNWHMRKHGAERNYRFACEICSRRFEKRDNVTAHRSKCHADHVTSDLPKEPTASDLSPT